MICPCCTEVVKLLLQKFEIPYVSINSGVIELTETVGAEKIFLFGCELQKYDLELVTDLHILLPEKIKKLIIELVYKRDKLSINLSDYLSQKLHYNYTYLSNLFRLQEGKTIEHFLIEKKIHRAKELLTFENLSLTETANMLNYSSTAHLSKQFKKVTGQSPSLFKLEFLNNGQKK
ncbi:hypothetical protein SAE01_06640 [Segetibacter aerophilus]|uniref:HTH araC/xylS-type domain-containing protein n=2 Tax=Segetibacter aerophilus TaxID=670293 RepID=A0A512B884_9BACT|nr:hypothetical protein SAE01_06640 [Segetibacter aerophilus]